MSQNTPPPPTYAELDDASLSAEADLYHFLQATWSGPNTKSWDALRHYNKLRQREGSLEPRREELITEAKALHEELEAQRIVTLLGNTHGFSLVYKLVILGIKGGGAPLLTEENRG